MSNYTDIVGFTYEADIHCPECAAERFGWCACGVPNDVHGEDQDGNEIMPVYAGSEGVDDMICCDCEEPLI